MAPCPPGSSIGEEQFRLTFDKRPDSRVPVLILIIFPQDILGEYRQVVECPGASATQECIPPFIQSLWSSTLEFVIDNLPVAGHPFSTPPGLKSLGFLEEILCKGTM